MAEDNRNKPLYMISVAAELTGMHPQTLRVYESKGLVNPQRSGGNTRLYSRADIERLELINQLTDEGINLAGVVRILDMKERAEERERENEKLRARVRQLEDELHEYKMQKKITALAPRDGSVNPEQVMRKLLEQEPTCSYAACAASPNTRVDNLPLLVRLRARNGRLSTLIFIRHLGTFPLCRHFGTLLAPIPLCALPR